MSSDSPSAEALLTNERERFLCAVGSPGVPCNALDDEDSVS